MSKGQPTLYRKSLTPNKFKNSIVSIDSFGILLKLVFVVMVSFIFQLATIMQHLQEKHLRMSARDYLKYIYCFGRTCPLCVLFSCLGVPNWINRERELNTGFHNPLLSVLVCGDCKQFFQAPAAIPALSSRTVSWDYELDRTFLL